MTIVYWTYFSINRSIDAATEDQEALETGRMLSELIKKDIRGISVGRYSLKATNQTVEGWSLGQMEFVTTAGFYSDPLRLRRIGYELFIDDKGDRILVRKESKDLIDPLDSTATVYELSRIVKGFRLEFYDGTDWTKAWDSDAAGGLPQQIRVTFDISDTKGNDKTFAAEESIQSKAHQREAQSNEEGFILVTVLLVIALLFPLVLAFNSRVQLNLTQAENFRDSVQALRGSASRRLGAMAILKQDDPNYDSLRKQLGNELPVDLPHGGRHLDRQASLTRMAKCRSTIVVRSHPDPGRKGTAAQTASTSTAQNTAGNAARTATSTAAATTEQVNQTL